MAGFEAIILHQGLTERLDDGTFDLAFDALRIDRTADIMSGPDAEHLDLAGDGVDFDLGDLAAKDIGLPGPAGTVDGVKAGMVGGERTGADGHDAALLADVDGFGHGHLQIGALGPDLAVEGANGVGLDLPMGGDFTIEFLPRIARGERHAIADHVGLTGGAGMGRLGGARGVVVAEGDVFGADAKFVGGDLGQEGQDAFADLGDASDDLGGAAIVEFDPGAGAVDGGGTGDAVPGGGDAAAADLAGGGRAAVGLEPGAKGDGGAGVGTAGIAAHGAARNGGADLPARTGLGGGEHA